MNDKYLGAWRKKKDSGDTNLEFILIYSILRRAHFHDKVISFRCIKSVHDILFPQLQNWGKKEIKKKFSLNFFHSRIFSVFLLQLYCRYIPIKEW